MALLVTKQDITARHIAGGARVDTNLTHNEVRSVAQGVVNQVLATVPTGSMAYVAAGRDYRIQIEVWGFSTKRGNMEPLVYGKKGKNDTHVTEGMLRNTFKWRSVGLNFMTNNADNCNMVEACVHEILHGHPMSIWLRPRAGSVQQGKNGGIFTFTLWLAYGPSMGIQFRATHPRKLPRLPKVASTEQLVFEQVARPIEWVARPNATRQVARPTASRQRILDEDNNDDTKPCKRFVILDDDNDDDDDATKPPATEEQVTEQPSKNPPLIDLTNNGGTKPKAKVQRTFSDLL